MCQVTDVKLNAKWQKEMEEAGFDPARLEQEGGQQWLEERRLLSRVPGMEPSFLVMAAKLETALYALMHGYIRYGTVSCAPGGVQGSRVQQVECIVVGVGVRCAWASRCWITPPPSPPPPSQDWAKVFPLAILQALVAMNSVEAYMRLICIFALMRAGAAAFGLSWPHSYIPKGKKKSKLLDGGALEDLVNLFTGPRNKRLKVGGCWWVMVVRVQVALVGGQVVVVL